MVCEMSKEKSPRQPLLPVRHVTSDFFVCDIFDAVPKGDMASMEHPIFSLSTKPDHCVRRYEHKGCWIEVKPSSDGLATVHDRDILIYCISQLIAAMNEGRAITQTMRFKAYDLLVATNRMTNGRGYELLKAALERLRGTSISTNIVTGGKETFNVFGLIESAQVVRQTRDGRMQEVEVKLSDWVFNAIEACEVLTLHRDYFRLRKPIERRMYELARKHCGNQREWRISLEYLQKKCGSSSTIKEFRRLVTQVIQDDRDNHHMPDYEVTMMGNIVIFTNRETVQAHTESEGSERIRLSPDVYERAREVAPQYDVYWLEKEWRNFWVDSGKPVLRNPDAAFIAFCRRRHERKPNP